MAETRDELARHLSALKDRLFHPPQVRGPATEKAMPTQKKASRGTASSSQGGSSKSQPTPKDSSKREAKADSRDSEPKKETVKASPMRKRASSKAGETSSRKRGTSSTQGKSSPKGEGESLVAKTVEVLDPLLAGAIVGAVTGAARKLEHEPTALPPDAPASLTTSSKGKKKLPTTGEVLEELASGAAVGAVAGVAKTVLPADRAQGGKKKGSKS